MPCADKLAANCSVLTEDVTFHHYQCHMSKTQKQKLHDVLRNDNYLNTFVSSEKLRGQQFKFYYNYLKCV